MDKPQSQSCFGDHAIETGKLLTIAAWSVLFRRILLFSVCLYGQGTHAPPPPYLFS